MNTISPELIKALKAHTITPLDLHTSYEEMYKAKTGTSWKIKKKNVTITIIKNSENSYTVQTDQ